MYSFRELSEVSKNRAIESGEHSKSTLLNDPNTSVINGNCAPTESKVLLLVVIHMGIEIVSQ